MKYSKPSLRSFNSESEMFCGMGSAASGSGCTNGLGIGNYCGFGEINWACVDGESANGCLTGVLAETYGLSCYTGNSPY